MEGRVQSIGGMGNIFISYRRDDSLATAGRLRDKLVQVFRAGQVFIDIEDLQHGRDFVTILEGKIAECDALLAVIGPKWLDARDDQGRRRLDNPDDFVAIEVGTALRRETIAVIPVLVDGARMPSAAELPDPLKALARRNAIELRNTQFGGDSDRIVRSIKAALGRDGGGALPWGRIAAGLVCIGVLAAGSYVAWPALQPWMSSAPPTQPAARAPADGAREPAAPASNAATSNAKQEVAAAIVRLREILRQAEGRLAVQLRGGNRVKLGDQIVFEVTSQSVGRLLLLDVNAAGEVAQIFPNSFLSGDLVARIPKDRTIPVPGPGYGFSGFKAVEPAGRSTLIALVQPETVSAERLAMVREQIAKGFEPVNAPGAYLHQLIEHVAGSVGDKGKVSLDNWAFGLTEYEIVK